jgi:hypothetical protein
VDGRPYTVAADRDPAPLPGWLAARLAAPAAGPSRPATAPAIGSMPAYVAAALAAETAVVADTSEGSRNHALFEAATSLGRLVAGGALPAELVTAELERAAAAAGLEPAETAATIRSGLRKGARRPHRPGQVAA